MPVRILCNSPAAYKHSFVPSGTVNLALLLAVFPLFLLAPLPCKVLRPNMSEFLLQAEHCSHCPPHRLRLTIHYLSPRVVVLAGPYHPSSCRRTSHWLFCRSPSSYPSQTCSDIHGHPMAPQCGSSYLWDSSIGERVAISVFRGQSS
jgi:hypothetical protein